VHHCDGTDLHSLLRLNVQKISVYLELVSHVHQALEDKTWMESSELGWNVSSLKLGSPRLAFLVSGSINIAIFELLEFET
jgi:hypothetical protein